MADANTVARPYAKALFELALQEGQVSQWSDVLVCLTALISNHQTVSFIRNPSTTADQHSALLFSVLQARHTLSKNPAVEHFLQLLSENKRLMVLPNIAEQFNQRRAEHEKTLKVDVTTFSPFTVDQEGQLIKRLSELLQRKITLNIHVDKSLQGGAIIRAGHLVIDGSVATQIKKLSANLAA
jgi:F-type H+-transporting ATPase subunit delta